MRSWSAKPRARWSSKKSGATDQPTSISNNNRANGKTPPPLPPRRSPIRGESKQKAEKEIRAKTISNSPPRSRSLSHESRDSASNCSEISDRTIQSMSSAVAAVIIASRTTNPSATGTDSNASEGNLSDETDHENSLSSPVLSSLARAVLCEIAANDKVITDCLSDNSDDSNVRHQKLQAAYVIAEILSSRLERFSSDGMTNGELSSAFSNETNKEVSLALNCAVELVRLFEKRGLNVLLQLVGKWGLGTKQLGTLRGKLVEISKQWTETDFASCGIANCNLRVTKEATAIMVQLMIFGVLNWNFADRYSTYSAKIIGNEATLTAKEFICDFVNRILRSKRYWRDDITALLLARYGKSALTMAEQSSLRKFITPHLKNIVNAVFLEQHVELTTESTHKWISVQPKLLEKFVFAPTDMKNVTLCSQLFANTNVLPSVALVNKQHRNKKKHPTVKSKQKSKTKVKPMTKIASTKRKKKIKKKVVTPAAIHRTELNSIEKNLISAFHEAINSQLETAKNVIVNEIEPYHRSMNSVRSMDSLVETNVASDAIHNQHESTNEPIVTENEPYHRSMNSVRSMDSLVETDAAYPFVEANQLENNTQISDEPFISQQDSFVELPLDLETVNERHSLKRPSVLSTTSSDAGSVVHVKMDPALSDMENPALAAALYSQLDDDQPIVNSFATQNGVTTNGTEEHTSVDNLNQTQTISPIISKQIEKEEEDKSAEDNIIGSGETCVSISKEEWKEKVLSKVNGHPENNQHISQDYDDEFEEEVNYLEEEFEDDYCDDEGEKQNSDTDSNENRNKKGRSIRFAKFDKVHEIPAYDKSEQEKLFYSKDEIWQFWEDVDAEEAAEGMQTMGNDQGSELL